MRSLQRVAMAAARPPLRLCPVIQCSAVFRPVLAASASPVIRTFSSAAAATDAGVSSSSAALTTKPPAPLFVTTRPFVTGRRVTKDLGLVAASAVRSCNLLVDAKVTFTRIFGGETPDYTQLLNECTEKATLRLEATARAAGATSIVDVRYATTATMNRVLVGMHVSVLASGTAVVDEPEGSTAQATNQTGFR